MPARPSNSGEPSVRCDRIGCRPPPQGLTPHVFSQPLGALIPTVSDLGRLSHDQSASLLLSLFVGQAHQAGHEKMPNA